MIKKKILAFTLAEILIALAVVGIVAALTVPRAMTGTNTKANVVKLKRAYSGIQEALRMASAKAGYDMSDITALDNSAATSHPYNAQDLLATAFDATVKGAAHDYSAMGKPVQYHATNGAEIVAYSSNFAVANVSSNNDLTYVGRNGIYYIIKKKSDMSSGCTVATPCILYIDINGGGKKPDRIVTCTSDIDDIGLLPLDNNGVYEEPEACTVDDNGVTDIYPFFIYDAEVRPATKAVVAVLEK